MLTAGARNQLNGTAVMVATRLMPMKDAAVPDEQHSRTNQHALAVKQHISSFRTGPARVQQPRQQLPKYSNLLSQHAQYLASAVPVSVTPLTSLLGDN